MSALSHPLPCPFPLLMWSHASIPAFENNLDFTYERKWEFDWMIWMRNVPQRLRYVNPWPTVGGAVWEGYGTFRRRTLSLEEVWEASLGAGFGLSQSTSCSLFPFCAWSWRCVLSVSCSGSLSQCLSCHCGLSLEPQAHALLSIHSFWSSCLIIATESALLSLAYD